MSGSPASSRAAVLLLTSPLPSAAAPPGCDPAAFTAAMAEDVLTVFAELDQIDEVIAFCDPAGERLARSIAWPGTSLLHVPAPATPADVLHRVAALGYRQAALVAADAPDLPALHLAKVFSALDSATAAAAVAVNGGVVILASRLPPTGELGAADMDRPPPPGVRQTLPWRRLRWPADLALLDPGLEGWEATRGLLSAGSSPGST